MKKAIIVTATIVAALVPLVGYAITTYDEGHYTEKWDSINVITRYPELGVVCPEYPSEPHAEVEVTDFQTASSVHVCGTVDDLRIWAQIFTECADALERP